MGVAAVLLLHVGLLSWAALRASVTSDEYAHLPAGVAYWKYREFSIHNLSPPLLRMLGAWPAVLAGADAPPASSYRKYDDRQRHWTYGEAFMESNRERYHRYFVLGRLAMIPWSCLGGLIVFVWSRQLYGPVAGIASCAVYSLEPNILAHASLVGTDAGLAVAMLGAVYLWQRFCRTPTWSKALLASLAISAAILCKFTALLITPMMVGIGVWGAVLNPRQARRLLGGLLIAGLIVAFVVNLAYGYWKSFRPLGSYELRSSTLVGLQQKLPGWLPVPLPREFVRGFDAQQHEAELLPAAYALGEQYRGSRWYYYPLALLCKLPLSIWALILIATILTVRTGVRSDEWPLIISIVVYLLGMALLADVNVGLRYLLPILPPIFVLIGRIWREKGDGALFRRGALVGWGLVGLLLLESVSVAPRFLTFFNRATGGAQRAQFILNDSNLDWGQELLDLRDWMTHNKVTRIGLAYFGRVDPRVYGIEYTPLIEGSDEPFVAVSSYYLTGMAHRMRTSAGISDFINLPYHRELRAKQPVATVGRMMYIYRREDVEAATIEYMNAKTPTRQE